MAIIPYKNILISNPTGEGGRLIENNLKTLADGQFANTNSIVAISGSYALKVYADLIASNLEEEIINRTNSDTVLSSNIVVASGDNILHGIMTFKEDGTHVGLGDTFIGDHQVIIGNGNIWTSDDIMTNGNITCTIPDADATDFNIYANNSAIGFMSINNEGYPGAGIANISGSIEFNPATFVTIYGITGHSTQYGGVRDGTVTIGGGTVVTPSGGGYYCGLDRVVGPRKKGWSLPTGTSNRTAFSTATVDVSGLAQRLKALIEDLYNGQIGS